MMPKRQVVSRGFTLIELLVVIAIIGLLSSIIAVSLKGAQDEAILGQAKSFYGQVSHIFGTDAMGIWQFDGNGQDSSGRNNDASVISGVAFRDSAACGLGFNGCLEFDGSNDYAHVPSSDDLNFGASGSFTLTAWINFSAMPSGVEWTIIQKREGGSFSPPAGGSASSLPGYMMRIQNNRLKSVIDDGTNARVEPYGTVMKENTWHFVALAFDRAGVITGFVDGKKDGESDPLSVISGSIANSREFEIGGHNGLAYGGTTGNFFDGFIDQAAVYRDILSVGEIERLYAQGLEKHGIARSYEHQE